MNKNLKFKNNFTFNWVLINKLAIGISPTKKDHINFLKGNNIKNILGLCGEHEAKWHFDLENNFNCLRINLPDSNQKKLPTYSQIDKAYNSLKKFVDSDITYIHCFAAVERSPLLCIMLIMEKYNLNIEESLDYVKRIHNLTNPRNNQLLLIKNYNFN